MATYFDRITGLAEQEWQAANACTDVTKKDEYLFRAAKYGHIDALFAFAAECVGTRAAQVSEKELKNIYKKISKFSDKLKKAKSSEDAFAIADKCLSWDDKSAPRYQYILGNKVAQFGKLSLTMLNAATAGDPEAMLAVQEQASTNDNIADFYTGRILYAGKFNWDQMLKYAFCGMGFDYSPYYPKGFTDIPGMSGGVDISSIRANAYEQLLKTLEFFAVPAKQGTEEYKARFGDFMPDEDTVMIARYWFYTKDARLTESNEITAYKEKVVAEIDKAIKLERLKAIGSVMEAEDKKKAAETPKPQATDAGKTIMVKDVFQSGASYEGEALNGKRHGKGIYRFTDGRIYEGDFVANERTGKGKMTWANGDVYEGDFIDGDRTGKGDYRWPNGDRYIGDFVNDRMTGCGTYYYANGDRYEGGFLDDKRHGKGKYTFSDGRYFTGVWENDKKVISSPMMLPGTEAENGRHKVMRVNAPVVIDDNTAKRAAADEPYYRELFQMYKDGKADLPAYGSLLSGLKSRQLVDAIVRRIMAPNDLRQITYEDADFCLFLIKTYIPKSSHSDDWEHYSYKDILCKCYYRTNYSRKAAQMRFLNLNLYYKSDGNIYCLEVLDENKPYSENNTYYTAYGDFRPYDTLSNELAAKHLVEKAKRNIEIHNQLKIARIQLEMAEIYLRWAKESKIRYQIEEIESQLRSLKKRIGITSDYSIYRKS